MRNFSRVLQPRHDRAADPRHPGFPDLRLDGFIGPGHVSTVVGDRPYEFIAGASTASRWWSPGFEPLDILQSVAMLLRQIREGRCEVENQYKRVVPERGQPARRWS